MRDFKKQGLGFAKNTKLQTANKDDYDLFFGEFKDNNLLRPIFFKIQQENK